MEFKTLFSILKDRLSDGDDVPYFFRELMAMITSVTEAEWGTRKDPSNRVNDETIRTIVKRKLTKAFAKSIIYRLTPENLIRFIRKRPPACREALAEDLRPYDATVNANNVGEVVAKLICNIVREAAGLVEPTELVRQRQQEASAELKSKYGELLRNEAGDCCPFPGCGKELIKVHGDRSVPCYEVSAIERDKEPVITNLIALCPECYALYSIDNDKKIVQELIAAKNILLTHKSSRQLTDSIPLEKGITSVISRIQKLNEQDLADVSFDPKEIRQKLSPAECLVLYKTVNSHVSDYFVRIKDIMTSLDKRGEIDYEAIQNQMRTLYCKLKKSNKSKEKIFYELAEKIHRVTLQDPIYCQIVVSYFVQSCEVFDAITE